MDQFNSSIGLEIEHRRPGLWIIQCRLGGRTHLFTVELGQDRLTFAYYYRVVCGHRAEQFPDIAAAYEFCSLKARAAR